MSSQYDVIIVGSGPAGIFAALELSKAPNLKILIIEKGKDIDQRQCPILRQGGPCIHCSPCNLVCGVGGAGAFSDGKLTISAATGGRLPEYLGENETDDLVRYVDNIYLNFGAPEKVYGIGPEVERVRREAAQHKLHLVPMPIRHLGTERCHRLIRKMRDYVLKSAELKLKTEASSIITENGRAWGIKTSQGEELSSDYLILAPGREGSDWLAAQIEHLGLAMEINPIDVGVRVEVPAEVMRGLTEALYEAKLEFTSQGFNDRVRTFCMCPAGEVITETTGGDDPVITVNGHSYSSHHSPNTNFALLVSTTFTKPFREPIAYGKYLARLANLLSDGVLVQRLGDLLEGHRSTPERISRGRVKPSLGSATPGDISFVLPYRHLTDIVEMLKAMDKLVPGVASPDTLLYGLEVKFYSSRPRLKPNLETDIQNMFAAGDGAGVSRGLVQASASGIVAAREILKRCGLPIS